MRTLFSFSAVNVQVSDEYVTTGHSIVLYIFILVFFCRNFDFISFALAYYALLHFAFISAIPIFILLSKLKMEPRELKLSTFSKAKLSIFRCVISFVPIPFI